MGVGTVAMKLGQDGGLACRSGGEPIHQPAMDVQVVDTTGAGDTFDAAFLAGWLPERSIDRALELAVACGTLSTRALGGTTAQPTLSEARSLIHLTGGSGIMPGWWVP